MKHRTKAACAGVQQLEQRVLLAGDVTVTFDEGDLIVRGDRADNVIEIAQNDEGAIEVTGDETTVNGAESAEFEDVEALLIRVHTGGADEVTVIGPIELGDDLRARLGDGGDELLIDGTAGPVAIGGDLNVRGGAGSNLAILNDVRVDGHVTVRTGGAVSATGARGTLFDYTEAEFSNPTNVTNPYFPLVPGAVYEYAVEEEDQETGEISRERVIVEVLSETRMVAAGVEVRVVRDRVFELEDENDEEGRIVEDTHDFFAQDDDGNVWYFGEEVVNFRYDDEGNLISTNSSGSFEVGEDDALAGIIMLADPTVGERYFQEFLPGDAIDVGEVLETGASLETDAGNFDHVLRTEDVNPLEPDELENKFYAPGVGMVGEDVLDIEDNEVAGTVRLVSLTLNGQPVERLLEPNGFDGTNPEGGETIGTVEFNDKAHIDAEDAVLLNGIEADRLRVDSDAEVFVIDSTLDGSSSIRAAEDVSIKEMTASRPLKISGDLDLFIFRSDIERLKVRLGSSDDELVVEDSSIDRFDVDGGRGENVFEERGENDIDSRRVRRFSTE